MTPRRSALFMPGHNERAIAKAKTLDCDVVILDLEDAVAPDTKLRARSTAQAALADGGFDPREIAIRVNGFGTEWMAEDLTAFHQVALDALVVPKAESAEDVFTLGEQMDAIETFEPGRIAGRILGMGDIVALVEKAQATIEAEQAERMMKRFQKGRFNMNDLKMQLEQMLKMGGMESMMGMLPGMAKASKQMSAAGLDDTMLKRQIALINSMTKKERANPDLMQASRKKRVAAGAGLEVSELNRLLKQQKQMADMMKKMGKMGKGGALKQMMKGMMGKGGGMPDLNDPAALEEAAKAMGAKLPGNLPGLGGGMQLPGNLAGFGKKK